MAQPDAADRGLMDDFIDLQVRVIASILLLHDIVSLHSATFLGSQDQTNYVAEVRFCVTNDEYFITFDEFALNMMNFGNFCQILATSPSRARISSQGSLRNHLVSSL